MRKTIRLTGRRQLPIGAFDFQLVEVKGQTLASLTVANDEVTKAFPLSAAVRVKLTENKRVEILDFGTILRPANVVAVGGGSFLAPSCKVRIVSRASDSEGKLLGSTTTWTYKTDGSSEGILLFQPSDIAPRLFQLDLRDEEYPILYVDKRIPDAGSWAKSDPLFTACVFPQVISDVFERILEMPGRPDSGWMAVWVDWANSLMPGSVPPYGDSIESRKKWKEELIDTFAAKHQLSDRVLDKLGGIKIS